MARDYLGRMKVSEVVALLEELTPAERLEVAERAVRSARLQAARAGTELPSTAEESDTTPTLLQRLAELPPMTDEAYEAYQEAIRLTSQIDWDEWR